VWFSSVIDSSSDVQRRISESLNTDLNVRLVAAVVSSGEEVAWQPVNRTGRP
jgi:hypothetical protein